MKMYNKLIIALVSFLLIACVSRMALTEPIEIELTLEPKPVFSQFDFTEDGYCMYATFWWDHHCKFADSLGMFYVSNFEDLNQLQKSWTLMPSDNFYECGYDYRFYLTQYDSIVKVLDLNLECKSLVSGYESYVFDSNNLLTNFSHSGNLEKLEFTFLNRNDAITKLHQLKTDSSFFVPYKSNYAWENHPGSFEFQYFDQTKLSKKSVDSTVNSELTKLYSQNEFKLKAGSYGSDGTHEYRMFCDSTLFLSFTKYKVSESFSRPLQYNIIAYRKLPITPHKK